jgi:hypothetical protein
MKTVWRTCVAAFFLLATLSSFGVQPSDTVAPPPVNSCSYFAAGTGGDIGNAARSLRVDLDHGISLMMLPGNIAVGPPYAISLIPASGGEWSLTYAVDKGTFVPSRAFRATVSLPAISAQRIENVWTHAIASARQDKSLDCIVLDGMSYIFSANGRQANILGLSGGIPAHLVEISDTLRIIFMDTKNTGHAIGIDAGNLSDQLNHIEDDLKISSQH